MRRYPSTSAESHEHQPLSRRSFLEVSALMGVASTTIFSSLLADRVRPAEQPDRFPPSPAMGYVSMRALPQPDLPTETILRELLTPEEYEEFVVRHCSFQAPSFPIEFFDTYRRSPEEFQQAGWRGCCNDFAELACTWAHCHHHTPYLISTCPDGVVTPLYQGWHQFAVIRTDEQEFVFFDNQQVIRTQVTPEQYIRRAHPEHRMLPFGGCVRWTHTQDNWTARMAYQSVPNETDLSISTPPEAVALASK